jgi:FtsZ-interacting cell division protein ZipA
VATNPRPSVGERTWTLIRTSELPDARMVILFPIVAVAIAILLIIALFTSNHSPAPAASQSPTTTSQVRTTKPDQPTASTLPSMSGRNVVVPAKAVSAVQRAATDRLSTSPTSMTVVNMTTQSVTCSVTAVDSQGQSHQTLVTVVDHAGTWEASSGT